jgi:hypothetical protein
VYERARSVRRAANQGSGQEIKLNCCDPHVPKFSREIMKTRGVQGMVKKTLNCKVLEYEFSSLRALNVQARDQISEPGSMPTSEMTTRRKPSQRHIYVSSSARVEMCLTSHKEALRSPYPRCFNSHSCLSQLGPPYTPQPPLSTLIQRVLSSHSLSQLGPTKPIQHRISLPVYPHPVWCSKP